MGRMGAIIGVLSLITAAASAQFDRVDITPGTVKATPDTIRLLVSHLGPGVYHRISACTPPPPWGTGSQADEAAAQLVKIGFPAVPYLLPLADVKEEATRALVIETLGRIRGQAVLTLLANAVRKDESERVRESAVEALTNIIDRRSTDALIVALADSSPAVQSYAVQYLTLHPTRRALKPLVTILENERGGAQEPSLTLHGKFPIAETAARALGQIGPDAWPDIKRLYSDPDARIHVLATSALACCKDRRAIPDLIHLTASENSDTRRTAILTLGHWNDPRSIRTLVALLTNGPHGDTQSTAALSLASMGGMDALGELFEASRSPDSGIRYLAQCSFLDIHDRRAAPLLRETLKSHDETAVRSAAFVLGSWREPGALPTLVKLASAPEEETRRIAIGMLGGYESQTVIGPLLKALSDVGPWVRIQAIGVLVDKRDPRIVPSIKRLLQDPSADVRQNAKLALARVNKPKSSRKSSSHF